MNQPSLPFGSFHARRVPSVETPAARNSDPHTSHEAADNVTDSGQRSRNQRAVLELVKKHPGKTSAELGKELSMLDRTEIARRLPELRTANLVCNGKSRVCMANGTVAMTWWPL